MDEGPGAVTVSSSSVETSAKSFITRLRSGEEIPASVLGARSKNTDYAVADLFGRCFLRVCFWVNVFSSLARRGEPMGYVPSQPKASPMRERSVQELPGSNAIAAVSGSSRGTA